MPKDVIQRSGLPYNPLLFADPLRPSAGAVPGAALLSELPEAHALAVWDVLRTVLLFAAGADEQAWYAPAHLRAWEESILRHPSLHGDARVPLGALVRELAAPRRADVQVLSRGCLALADWALANGWGETALAWAEAAALVQPANARMAWIAGRMFRQRGRLVQARHWLRRAHRLGVWTRDVQIQVRALLSLGNLHLHEGSYPSARRVHERALRQAVRHRLKDEEAMALHDLFISAFKTGKYDEADKLWLRALRSYGPGHEQIPKFAHDVAYFWLTRGHFDRALAITGALAGHFELAWERLRVLATAIRCAGACGDRERFETMWRAAQALESRIETTYALASCHLDMGYGASSLENWDRAEEVLRRAAELGQITGEADIVMRRGGARRGPDAAKRRAVHRPFPLRDGDRSRSVDGGTGRSAPELRLRALQSREIANQLPEPNVPGPRSPGPAMSAAESGATGSPGSAEMVPVPELASWTPADSRALESSDAVGFPVQEASRQMPVSAARVFANRIGASWFKKVKVRDEAIP